MSQQMGRSPQGERGLKYVQTLYDGVAPESLPTGGAWVEIRTIIHKIRM